MTEQEFLASADPAKMLQALTEPAPSAYAGDGGPDRPSDRKLRLFAVAMWRGHPDILARYGVPGLPDLSERIADGLATEEDVSAGREAIGLDVIGCGLPYAQYVVQAARHLSGTLLSGPRCVPEKKRQAALLRDIVGNVFRPVILPPCTRCDGDGKAHGADRPFTWSRPGSYPGLCPACNGKRTNCPWLTPQVLALAQVIYDTRDFSACPILADALEEAGCVVPRLPVSVVVAGQPGGHVWEVVQRVGSQNVASHVEGSVAKALRWAERHLAVKDWYHESGVGVSTSMDWIAHRPHYSAEGLTPESPHPLLAHLRGPGPHVRGCWAIDCVLGKS